MRKMRDFKCQECGHIEELLIEDEVKSVVCPECASNMRRMLSAPVGYGNCAHGGLKKSGGFN